MKIRTELLEYLTRQCVREVLDQLKEEAKASTLKSSGIGKDDNKEPAKQKVPVKPFKTGHKQGVNIKKLDEAENPELSGDVAPPAGGQGTGDQPAIPKEEPKPEPPKTEEPPEEPEVSAKVVKGSQVINPRDKSKLIAIRWRGKDDTSIANTLYDVAMSMAGTNKVSFGAKKLGRESVSNPNLPIYFYFGKTEPDSEEVFLMADKSLAMAKKEAESVTVADLRGGQSLSSPSPMLNYGNMTDQEYTDYMNTRYLPKPRYGIDEPEPEALDEGAAKLIKKMVNRILDS